MNQPVRFLLLSDNIKQQLQQHTLKVVEAWASRWGLFEGSSWVVDIFPALGGVEFKKIDVGSSKNNELFFGLNCAQSKHFLSNELTQKNMASTNSKLLDSIVKKALSDFQMDYVLGQLSFDEIIVEAKSIEDKLPEYIKNNNMISVRLSTNKFQIMLLLSMPLINILVEESEVDDSQQAISLDDSMNSVDDELIEFKVVYGDVDISVEELATIRIGDVICLDKSISSPMSASDHKGNSLFDGYLGVKEKKLALKVAAKN